MSEAQPVVVKKRRWRGWQVTCLVVAVLAVSLWGYRIWRQWRMEVRLRTIIARIEMTDPHWRFEDLLAKYEAMPVSPTFVKAIEVTPMGYRGWYGDDIADRPGAVEYIEDGKHFNVRMPESYFNILKERLLEEKVQPYRQALFQLHLEGDGYRLPWYGRNPPRETLEHRRVERKIGDERLYAMHMGDTRQFIAMFKLSLENARLVKHAPTDVRQLTSVALYSSACESVKRALAFCQFNDAELVELEKILLGSTAILSTRDLIRVLRADTYEQLETAKADSITRWTLLEPVAGWTPSNATWQMKLTAWAKRQYYELTCLNLAEFQAEVLETAELALQFTEQQAHLRNQFLKNKLDSSTNPVLKSILIPLCKVPGAWNTHQVHFDTLRLALACERYRLRMGKWPETLTTLVPEYVPNVPLDAYSGKPLLYRVQDDGVVIYSVYMNGTDEGGDVLMSETNPMRDRGTRLFNPDKRGLKYDEK